MELDALEFRWQLVSEAGLYRIPWALFRLCVKSVLAFFLWCGRRGSSVSVVTRPRAVWPRRRSIPDRGEGCLFPWCPVRLWIPTPRLLFIGHWWSFIRDKMGRDVKLTTHFQLVPILMRAATSPHPIAFVASTETVSRLQLSPHFIMLFVSSVDGGFSVICLIFNNMWVCFEVCVYMMTWSCEVRGR
jgi:hypothetical protein